MTKIQQQLRKVAAILDTDNSFLIVWYMYVLS